MTKIIRFLVVTNLMIMTPIFCAPSVCPKTQETSMAIEWLRPSLQGVSSTFFTSLLFVTGRFPLSQNVTLVGDLPLAYFDGQADRSSGAPGFQNSASSTSLGNPYLGMEIRKQGFPLLAEVALRVPLGTGLQSRAALVGQATDTERFEAFTDYDISVKALLHYLHDFSSGYLLHLRAGWSGGHNFSGGPGNFSTLDYGIQLEYQTEQLNFTAGLAGRYLLDGRTFHMSKFSSTGLDRTTHQFSAAASVDYDSVRPGVYFSVLLDDYVNDVSSTEFHENMYTLYVFASASQRSNL